MKSVRTILMIDDDLDDQEIFRDVLHEIDPSINCLQSSSAELALDLLLKDGHRPDFIFLDINMPVMNGFEFLGEMMKHERIRNIPVIMFTTSIDTNQKEKAKKLGASDFITKPSALKSMKTTIEKVLLADHSN